MLNLRLTVFAQILSLYAQISPSDYREVLAKLAPRDLAALQSNSTI